MWSDSEVCTTGIESDKLCICGSFEINRFDFNEIRQSPYSNHLDSQKSRHLPEYLEYKSVSLGWPNISPSFGTSSEILHVALFLLLERPAVPAAPYPWLLAACSGVREFAVLPCSWSTWRLASSTSCRDNSKPSECWRWYLRSSWLRKYCNIYYI